MTKFRLHITDSTGNHSYITRDDYGNIAYFSESLVPMALANCTARAAKMKFGLEDADDGAQALAVVQPLLHKGYQAGLL